MYTFLVNPSSQSGQGERYWDRIREILEKEQIPYQVMFSRGYGDMTRFARELTSDPSLEPDSVHIVVLGGDGTVNEVLQGLAQFDKIRFSFIPTGSSNDLSRDIGIENDPETALRRILDHACEHRMDVGVLRYLSSESEETERRFLVSCGIGFDAAVCQKAMVSPLKDVLNKLRLGKLTYLGIALRLMIEPRRDSARLSVLEGADAQSETVHLPMKKFMFVTCMLHGYEGGGFYFCPGADAQDGILEVCTVNDISLAKVLVVLPTAFFGKHERFRQVHRLSGTKVRIQTSKPMWVHTDGEVHTKADDILVTCRQGLLRFYY